MNLFNSIGETTDKAADIGETYFKSSHQYLKLKIFQQLTLSVSMVTKLVVISAFLFLGIIFCAVAAALAIGDALENPLLGFLIVGVFFMLIAILIYVGRGAINRIVIQKIGDKFFS
ncbi:hypothetical protein OS188_04615 [Xanthomarina sp. F1114]|uniref:hypothetical protein n=1 Tax=Xanthomarina sp. F1114 TaxID=2996019 RepID=UPI00225E56F8|nr:hypothetical protein [Xanthomarina sp. F1114]MCX7547231.1 hypothetical protein [Xanthomarina sp. F1114]